MAPGIASGAETRPMDLQWWVSAVCTVGVALSVYPWAYIGFYVYTDLWPTVSPSQKSLLVVMALTFFVAALLAVIPRRLPKSLRRSIYRTGLISVGAVQYPLLVLVIPAAATAADILEFPPPDTDLQQLRIDVATETGFIAGSVLALGLVIGVIAQLIRARSMTSHSEANFIAENRI